MKKILFLCLFILGGTMPLYNEKYHLSRGEELVNITLYNAAEKIKKKYNLLPAGTGASMPGGPIRKLNLAFDTKEPYTKEKLRDLLIKCASELLDLINTNDEIQKFLIKAPFTIENVYIIIYNHDKNGREVYDPEICVSDIAQGVLTYKTTDQKEPLRYKNRITETYEEALKALSDG